MSEITGRRGFFKHAAFASAIGGVAAAIGFKAFADPAEHVRWHRGLMHAGFTPEQAEQRVGRMLKHFYVEIDATDARQQKLEPIVKQAAKDLMPLRMKMQEAKKQGIALLSAETIDHVAIETFHAQHVQLAESASRRFSQALADVADVLTPAQRKDLAKRIARMGRGMGGGMRHSG